jgi:hypothetical protein
MQSMRLTRCASNSSPELVVHSLILLPLLWMLFLVGSGGAAAQVAVDSSILPPESDPPNCDYTLTHYSGRDASALYPSGIDFSNLRQYCFVNVSVIPNPLNGDENVFFDATLEGTIDDGSGLRWVVFQGAVEVVVRGRAGNQTGSWQTEILSMDLSGDVAGIPVQIRVSPFQPSLGQTSVADHGAGRFVVDSFFDVFTDLSIGGGPFEAQINGPTRMKLMRRVRTSALLPTPDLPPEPDPLNCDRILSRYVGPRFESRFPNGILLSDPNHKCFTNVGTTVDPGTGDEFSAFDSIVEGVLDDGSGPQPVVLTGPMTTVARAKGSSTTGSWDTEILSMSLSGDVGGVSIDLRESPAKKSPGKKKIKKRPSGEFQVDSFFDVFTEISIDGGPFQPQTNPGGRIELARILPKATLMSSDLPPESDPPNCERLHTRYIGRNQSLLFPGGIDITDPIHKCFKDRQVTVDPATGDETQTVNSTLEAMIDDGSGPQPVVFSGPVTTVARGKGGSTTGSWDTEILSMNLTGDVGGIPVQIRESPKLKSSGKKKKKMTLKSKKPKKPNADRFVVDSFFDVFTEISIGGGPFIPQVNDAARLELEPIRPSVELRHPATPPEADPPNCDRLGSEYAGIAPLAIYPGGIDLSDVRHRCFQNVQRTIDPASGDETVTFDSTLVGMVDDGSGPQLLELFGPVTTVVRGRGAATTGSWDTEILSMSLTGDVGGVSIDIRESPSKKSPGKKKKAKAKSKKGKKPGAERFVVDSFFDVFTEISIGGGPFQPQTSGAGRLDLMPIRPSVARPDASLPPEPDPVDCNQIETRYESIVDSVLYPGGIDFSRLRSECFENVQTFVDAGTGDETAQFDSRLSGIIDDGSGPQLVELTGPITTVIRNKGASTTGYWETEMVSMSLTGDVGGIPVEIRESPSKKSPGKTKVKDKGDGTFHVDSFFDVFTEISVAGGPFQPQTNEAARVDLDRARPSAVLPQTNLPPEPDPADCDEVESLYSSMDSASVEFPGGLVLSEPIHKCFQNVMTTPGPGLGDETQNFDSMLVGMFDLGAGPEPVTLTGPVETRTIGRNSRSTGTWDTEMVSMSLSGDAGGVAIDIRESPSKKTEGKKKVVTLGGGQFEFDSFFDVFTEISVDGGPFMRQTTQAVRFELRKAPEPGLGIALLSALPVLRWMGRRRELSLRSRR